MRIGGVWTALLATLLSPLYGFDYDPWFRNLYEIELVASGSFVNYRSIDQGDASLPYSTDDQWVAFSAGGVVSSWLRVESEIELVRTPRFGEGIPFVGVLVQALLLHDVIGDPVTLVIGASTYASPMDANPSVWYHGRVGGELNVSVGKELFCGEVSQTRGWSVLRVGMADKGDPWAVLRGQIDHDFCDGQRLSLWVQGLAGVGNHSFPALQEFEGYGPLRHRSLDLGAGYFYEVPYLLKLYIKGEQRIFAENFPERVWMVTIGILYPFSL